MTGRRVLVCGSNYATSYLSALDSAGGAYRLAGILAQGSSRSRTVAERYGVPLYRDVEEIPDGIEIACAAMGSAAGDVVLRLLERGTHVLCEHPEGPDWVRRALQTAASQQVCVHINGHFAHLPAARAFTRNCRQLARLTPPLFVQLFVTDRSLYSAIDILRRAIPAIAPHEFDGRIRSGAICTLHGVMAGVETAVTAQCGPFSVNGESAGLQDGSTGYLIDHRITVGFPGGTLTLMSTSGPVVWNATMTAALQADGGMWETVYGEVLTAGELRRERIAANLRAIDTLVTHACGGVAPPDQRPDHLLEVSELWRALGTSLTVDRPAG